MIDSSKQNREVKRQETQKKILEKGEEKTNKMLKLLLLNSIKNSKKK